MSCATCPHFNKSKKQTYTDKFRYGCNASLDGYTWWTNSEILFNKFGCALMGDCEEPKEFKQMDIFEYLKGAGQ